MSSKKSHSAFSPNYHHRRDSPPPSPSQHNRRRRSPVRHSGNRAPMQTSAQSYSHDAPQQRNGRGGIVLPPGKNDLEILENLKQIIKNGQHEFYRAIPQPAALASLYLGTIPTGEPASKTAEDNQSAPIVHDDLSKEPSSPVESTTRPPRLKGKESWDSGSYRRGSLSKTDEQTAGTNGYHNEAPEGLPTPVATARQLGSEFVPPSSSGTDVIPPNGPMLTPPNDSRPPTRDRSDIIPASDDSSTAVDMSPAKAVSSPMSQVDTQDRDRNYSSRNEPNGYTQPTSYSRDDKREESVGGRYHRDSFAKPDDRYPARDDWRPHPQQPPYKSNYDASSRSYVKTEEVPISLTDLDSRAHLPRTGSGSVPSQNPPRNGNGTTERSFIDITDPASADTHGLPPGLSSASQLGSQYNSDRPAYGASAPTVIKSEPGLPPRRDTREDGPLSSTSVDQNGRSAPSHSDSARMPPPYKGNNRYVPRPPDKYSRPGSPGYASNNPRPPNDRTDNRGPPPRDYRPQPAPPKSVSRERDYRAPPTNNYRPDYDDRRPVERIDVDNDPRYNDQRQYRGFSPPTPAEMARDRQRQMHNRVPPSPRAATSDLAYESPSTRRYAGPPPSGSAPAPSTTERDWYPPHPTQPGGSYPPTQRWEEEPYYPARDRPANWDASADRGRYEPEGPSRRWEDRPDRDARDPYRAPPPAPAPANDRYVERGRPLPPPAAHGPPPYSRVRPRSPSPMRTGSRPPMKRQRDDYVGAPPPPSASSDYYSPHAPSLGPRDSVRGRPNDSYHSSGGGRGVSPTGPPPSSGSGFYDRSGPPPSTTSSAMSIDRDRFSDRGRDQERNRAPPPRDLMPPPRHRDSVEEYHPHAPSISRNGPSGGPLYDRPRSPPGGRTPMQPPSGGGGALGNRAASVSGGGYRDGYRGPPRDGRGYMPPPPPRS